MNEKLSFACDYARGAHPDILRRMMETNMIKTAGYGLDEISESARNRIRKACGCENAAVEFLVGGTQTNAVMVDALLKSYQGVIAAETGHISVHEAGAIEANGHKVLALPHQYGKISAGEVEKYLDNYYNDANHEHMCVTRSPTNLIHLQSFEYIHISRYFRSKLHGKTVPSKGCFGSQYEDGRYEKCQHIRNRHRIQHTVQTEELRQQQRKSHAEHDLTHHRQHRRFHCFSHSLKEDERALVHRHQRHHAQIYPEGLHGELCVISAFVGRTE